MVAHPTYPGGTAPGVGYHSPLLEGARTRTPPGHPAKTASSPEGRPSQDPPGAEIGTEARVHAVRPGPEVRDSSASSMAH